jgi:hypothetical protein
MATERTNPLLTHQGQDSETSLPPGEERAEIASGTVARVARYENVSGKNQLLKLPCKKSDESRE